MTYIEIQRPHTLTSIAAEAKTTKRTVQRWLFKAGEIGELQGDTRMFSDAERDTLLSYQAKRQATDKTPDKPVTQAATPVAITVIEGNHRNALEAPQFPTEFNLDSFRSELAAVDAHDDPLALAEQFINGADSLMDAMAEDEKAMAQKIAKTRQARQAVGRKVDQLKRRNDIYALRTELLADRQNVETAALNDDFEVLQSMGKQPGA
ncbi:hypothetical protein N836_13625 [Leptolyngbya sp. Heron Island J]|uniref:hypothetical protein n=1 Tax=Leptolyngbya sp. Heron Island J TaxID=1385935 RepID=UPI0003B98CD6|nr:hypothetical protein [Leptolyngbya sp. Heron Island J]ESA35100.1 hypothetical protein N836_13625 [Leptolyngbya sp. Heron Island J]